MDRRRQHGYFENKLNKNERVFFMKKLTERTYRTKEETAEYFLLLAAEFEKQAHRTKDQIAAGKAEAYRMAAFEILHNRK